MQRSWKCLQTVCLSSLTVIPSHVCCSAMSTHTHTHSHTHTCYFHPCRRIFSPCWYELVNGDCCHVCVLSGCCIPVCREKTPLVIWRARTAITVCFCWELERKTLSQYLSGIYICICLSLSLSMCLWYLQFLTIFWWKYSEIVYLIPSLCLKKTTLM